MEIGYFEYNDFLLEISVENDMLAGIKRTFAAAPTSDSPLVREVITQLSQYFEGKRKKFDLPVKFDSGFEGKIMRLLCEIPFGFTVTYGELARAAGKEKAYRYVGTCVGKNPVPIVVPCHRVVAKANIGGFGWGLDAKRTLLKLEGIVDENDIYRPRFYNIK